MPGPSLGGCPGPSCCSLSSKGRTSYGLSPSSLPSVVAVLPELSTVAVTVCVLIGKRVIRVVSVLLSCSSLVISRGTGALRAVAADRATERKSTERGI